MDEQSTTFTTTFRLKICRHLNGWYFTAHFGPFKRRYFNCQDCRQTISREAYEAWRLTDAPTPADTTHKENDR